MPGTKLFDLESKSNVEVDPSEVKAALATGRFAFGKGLNVPIIRDGAPMWVKPEYAHKYSDDLTFTTDEVVRSAQAESEYSGVGGIAKGLAYGGFKGATLGLGPLALGAASPAARKEMANAELGAPTASLVGEGLSLLVDPIAAGARAFGKGAAKGAGLAVEKGAEQVIAKEPLLLGEGAIPRRLGPGPLPSGEVDTRIGQGLRAQSRELPGDGVIKGLLDVGGEGAGPPRLGGKLPSAEAAGETARDIRTRLVGVPALPEKGVIRLGEMPSTLTGPPLESRLMTDLRNEQANLADRMIGLDKVISTEEKSRGKGSGAVLKILRGERDDVASRIEEYEFQLMKYERPEETALAEQAGRAEEQAAMGRYQTSFPDAHVLPGARRDILAEQRVAADAVMSARETKATEDARAAVMREGLPAEYTGRRPTAGGRTELATTARRPGIAEVMAAEDAQAAAARAGAAETQMGTDAAATSFLRASIDEDAAAMAAMGPKMGVTPGRELAVVGGESGLAALPKLGTATSRELAVVGESGLAALPKPGMAETAGQAAQDIGASRAVGLSIPRAVVEGGVYSAASQANRQQLGLEPGGVGEVAEAGLLGMGLGAAGHVLGKALGGGAKAFGSAVAGDAPAPAMTRIAKAAHGIQDAHLMRMWGTDAAAIERLNREFTDTPAGKKGVSAFADFIRAETADISALKAVSPQDAILQAIPSGVPLKFAQLTPERRTAISDAIRAKLGKQYDEALAPLDGVVIPQTGLAGVIKTMRASRIKGLGDETLRSIAPEFEAFTKSVAAGETQTVGSLREMRGAMDESFSIRNGLNKEFTKPQLEFRTALNNLVNEQMEVLAPGASAKFAALNKQYSMAKILQEGVISAETKFAASSPFNKETLSKAALGVAIGQPYGAAKFFVANAMLRGLYNSRGEGFIADMAGSVERAALNIGKDPVGAAKIASRSVLDAKRPIMMATNAERFVSGEPEDFINMSKAVRLLQSAKDEARQQVLRATSNLPVGEQQRVAAEWEAKIDALASSLPKGLSTGNALSEHEKRFVIFARSILDPAYATQVIANGGPEATDAANAIRSIPGGQVYLSSLAEDIRTQISESKALRANENAGRVYMNFSKQINASARALTIHGGGGGGGGGGGKTPSAMGMPKISASTHSAATKAIAASAAMTK